MKARQVEVFDKEGNLEKIEITLETGVHLFDALWDPTDEQTEQKRLEFRKWVKNITSQHGHELT
jgi:hypothetical protein